MELSIDTASELASIAASEEGRLLAEITWRCRRNHTVELLPGIDRLLSQIGAAKGDLTAVFACTGPGLYTGLRVGISAAQGLAYGLRIPALGVGRLELDAYPHAPLASTIVALHRAGRGDVAWAAYADGPWRELQPPALCRPEELMARLEPGALLVGETGDVIARIGREDASRFRFVSSLHSIRRAATLAELGFFRLSQGQTSDPALLRPIYLRPPAIGPQQRSGG